MIEDVLEGIATLLHELFPKWHIYVQPVEQGIELPCFVLSNISGYASRRIGGERHMVEDNYQIAVLSNSPIQIRNALALIIVSLDKIPVNDGELLTYEMDKSFNGQDGTITFKINSTIWQPSEPVPPMENLENHVRIDEKYGDKEESKN